MDTSLALPLHCTFEENDWKILARHWYPVATAADIVEAPLKATLLDEPLVLYRVEGELIVARDVCPHRGVPLSMGHNDGQGVVCPYHGLRFGKQGRCNRIPASPSQAVPARMHLRAYAAVERYGLVWVCLAHTAEELRNGLQPDVPQMPHWDDAGFQRILCPAFDVAAFAGRQLEGFIDVAHFAWVHTGTFADPNNAEVPAYSTQPTAKGFEANYYSNVGNYPIGVDGRAPAGFIWRRQFQVHLPFTATLTIHFPEDGRLVIMNAASPVSARQTRMFAPIARNFDQALPIEHVHEFNLRVFEEDRWVVESQKPECLPLDPMLEAHIPADMSSIAYRRGLRAQGLSSFFLH